MKFFWTAIPATIFIAGTLTGCLKTRNDVHEDEQAQVMQQQVVTMQKTNADATSRVTDLEEQMRDLNGRVDVVENKIGKNDSSIENSLKSSQQQNQELNQKMALLQEALTKLEADIHAVGVEVQAMKTEKAAAANERVQSKQLKNDVLDIGRDFFEKKDWKQSILNFQKYRDDHPKGKNFPEATYKIGVAFQELGMKDEAKTFYDEIVNKFPKSDEARRAKIRLKSLK
ncbi:MAG: tetratricopeptide repeat protein [Pseudobdellovibrionaceae bacterium]